MGISVEDRQYNNDRTDKKLEQLVLGILTAFSISMFVSSILLKWHIVAKEMIVAAVAVSWFIMLRNYRDHAFRAKLLALMVWINFSIYVFYSVSFTSVLSSMMVVIVLLGSFCISGIVWMGVFFSTLIMLYHVFVLQSTALSTLNDILRLNLHVLSVYVVSLVTWITIRTKQETSDQLMENIREMEIVEKSKDDFMVNVSHEIRTPINAVCGMSEAILQEDIPTNVRRDIIDIQTAGRNLLSTVSNILDFSELESGKVELAEESYNITSTITDIINMSLTLENGKHLELIVDCDVDLPCNLLGDEQKFRRIVMNLMENAIKFTKEGGIILRIKSRKEEYGVNLIVSIRDSGIGMEQEDLEKIFASFSQVNSGRNREEGGIGLGLAIAHALVSSMGGFITVESEPGNGTTFQFTIPQKVLDETPIVSIRNKSHIFAACYINMDKYDYSVVREGYEKCMRHIAEQFGIMFRNCKNLAELKRRMQSENYTHIFIGWEEYNEDKAFFDQLAKAVTVVLILDYEQETQIGSNMLRIYKPFTVLSIAAVFNGEKIIRSEEQHNRYRFVAPEAKVLVVDDNAMNLKVMARLLLPYQIKTVMALGGQEALRKLDTMEYDCVFLDHMMPEMDGVETLHRIRQKAGSYFQSLPVIAFTANAIGGAREMFMEEGFDDFIAKPIELSVLERMLHRYIPKKKQMEVKDQPEAPEERNADEEGTDVSRVESMIQVQEAAVSDAADSRDQTSASEGDGMEALTRAGINIPQGISYCGDVEGLREIITMYHQQGAGRKRQLQQLYEEQNWKNYGIAAHALKSNSRGIGANDLAELALGMEMAGKENRPEYIMEHHREFMQKHDELLKALAENSFIYPEGYQSPEEAQSESAQGADGSAGVVSDGKELPQIGQRSLAIQIGLLREKLDNFESDGMEEIFNELEPYRYEGMRLQEMTTQIRQNVEEFDFLGASAVLDEWEQKLEGSREG